MTRTQKNLDFGASLLFLVATAVYFSVWYGFHTINQEQLQLFEGTWAYFAETVAIPGGFADYLGRFLTQFCYYAWSGALVIAALLLLLAVLSFLYVGDWAASPETHRGTVQALDEKVNTVLQLSAASALVSSAVTLLPGDVGTPIADKLADFTS